MSIGDHRHIADLTLAEESLDGVTTKQQSLLSYNYNWLFGDQAYLVGLGSYERDPIRNLDKRVIAGAGLGYDIWDDAGRSFSIQAGLGRQSEDIDNTSDSTSIAFWGLRFGYDLNSDLEVFHNHTISTTLSGRDNTITKTSTGIRYEITDLLYLNFEVAYDYESNPSADAENKDLAVLAGFGLEF